LIVCFVCRHQGKVAFIGDVHYAKGTYVGVVMKDPAQGKNSGTVRGVEYFRCKPSERGLMVPLMDVTLVR
jgi:dynactin complex subunit